MRILLIGSTGQLGSDILIRLERKHRVTHGGRELFDIMNGSHIRRIEQGKYDAVINCAAFLDVPLAEKSPRDAMAMNAEAVMRMARACFKSGAKFIHFSTDYVFDGKKRQPYTEDDACNPLNVYGLTKYVGERMALAENPDAAVMRVSGLYGKTLSRAKGYNFISLFLKKAFEASEVEVVCDEVLTPTWTANVARQTEAVLGSGISGIIHSTDEGGVSWHGFASEIASYMKLKTKVKKIRQKGGPVERPKYSVLENRVLKRNKMNLMTHWRESLHSFLREVYL